MPVIKEEDCARGILPWLLLAWPGSARKYWRQICHHEVLLPRSSRTVYEGSSFEGPWPSHSLLASASVGFGCCSCFTVTALDTSRLPRAPKCIWLCLTGTRGISPGLCVYIYTYNWDLLVVCQCVVTEFMKKGANMRQKVVALVGFNIS